MTVRELQTSYVTREIAADGITGEQIHDPKSAAALASALPVRGGRLDASPVEAFGVLYLDAKSRVLAFEVLTVGTLTSTLVHPREVMRGAVLANAAAFIVFHNHPSGDPEPSHEDRAVAVRLKSCAQLFGLDCMDALTIGHDGRYVSLRERGDL